MDNLTAKHGRDKDHLLENVGVAIKQLQARCCDEASDFRLTGNLWEVQELCLHLDGTLNHGLRRLTSGYWPFVCEITHTSTRNVILGLPRAVSNIIKGWAWLYLALNDSALESYLLILLSHPTITEKHYLPHSMMRDTPRLQILQMMVAGLEHLNFFLDPDTACLETWRSFMNHCPSGNCNEDVEEAEVASVDSFASSQDTESNCDFQELGVITMVTLDSITGQPKVEDVVHSSIRGNRKKRKVTANGIVSTISNNYYRSSSVNNEEEKKDKCKPEVPSDNLTPQQQSKSLDRLVQQFKDSNFVITDRDSFLNIILQDDSDYPMNTEKSSVEPAMQLDDASTFEKEPASEETSVYDIGYDTNAHGEITVNNSIRGTTDGGETAKECSLRPREERSVYDLDDPLDKPAETQVSNGGCDSSPEPVPRRPKNSNRSSTEKRVSFHLDSIKTTLDAKGISQDGGPSLIVGSDSFPRLALSERGTPEGQEDPMTSSTSSLLNGRVASVPIKRDQQQPKLTGSPEKHTSLRGRPGPLFPSLTSVDKAMVKINTEQLDAEIKSEVLSAKTPNPSYMRGEVPLDSNFHLLIMLEVVADQEEKVYKVFKATTGHTVGVPVNLYVVLTDCRFYMTHWDINNNHYNVDASFSYSDIEFLQLSLNYQIINVVCASPRRRYWLCTGNEETTRNIVSSLEVVIRRSPYMASLPCVFTDSTTQSIAICKWVAEQSGCQAKDIRVDHYSLVTWEDLHAVTTSTSPVGPSKNGFLMYRFVGRSVFGNKQWAPGYFRLKAGVCYQFTDVHDSRFRSYVQLLGGECVGCRRIPNLERPHTFELILTGDRALQMAASSDAEASEWLQVFLQAVSQGCSNEEASLCVSACCILAARSLFVCHEELETNFLRCLGKAKVQDVSSVHLDPDGAPYCILEFESVEAVDSCGDWILNFSSSDELSKFLRTLESVWQLLYKVPLPRDQNTEPMLQKRSYDNLATLSAAS